MAHTLKSNQPIGIFDSGIGGLTIAKAIEKALPNESIIYFGDTAHLPYGDKSIHAIQGYARKISDFLLKQKVKLILIACNSASAAAYEVLQDYIGTKALLVNVIDPVTTFLSKKYSGKRIGLIATKLTVESSAYRDKLKVLDSSIDFQALATPLLVPIIEEGFFAHKLIDLALEEYLARPELKDITALVLGCTHYPVIKNKISDYYQNKIALVDAAKIVASSVKKLLADKKLLATNSAKHNFYVSDYTKNFENITKIFFGKKINIDEIDIF
jgi:glutamate racemase